jgi:hypothetical protein
MLLLPHALLLVLKNLFHLILTLLFQSKKKLGRLMRFYLSVSKQLVAKLPWAEAMKGPNGKLSMVKCKVCSSVEKIDKLLVLKFDDLQKHARQ